MTKQKNKQRIDNMVVNELYDMHMRLGNVQMYDDKMRSVNTNAISRVTFIILILAMSNMTFVSLSIYLNKNTVRWTRILFDLFAFILRQFSSNSQTFSHTLTHRWWWRRQRLCTVDSINIICNGKKQFLTQSYSQAHTVHIKWYTIYSKKKRE